MIIKGNHFYSHQTNPEWLPKLLNLYTTVHIFLADRLNAAHPGLSYNDDTVVLSLYVGGAGQGGKPDEKDEEDVTAST